MSTGLAIAEVNEAVTHRLEGALARAAGVRNLAEAQIVEAVAEASETGAWEGWGIRSLEHWVTWQLGATRSRAKTYTTIAKRRHELPETWRHFAAGLLSTDQVGLIARYCPAEFDASVAEFALVATIPQLAQSLRRYHWNPQPDPLAEDEPDQRPAPRRLTSLLLDDDSGEFDFHVTGPVSDGARLQAVLEQCWSRLRNDASGESDDAKNEISRYDAFLALVDAAAEADPSVSRRNRNKLLFHLDLDWSGELVGRLHLGPLLSVDDLRHLACDADAQVLFERNGRSLHLGRSHRIVPDWLRNVILDRDGGCRFPGCGHTSHLDVHHLVHWVDGGTTDPGNLLGLCGRHHTLHHQGQFTIEGDPQSVAAPGRSDGLIFRNPFGLVLRSRPPDPPSATAAGPPGPCYLKPLGERLDLREVLFHRARDN